MVIPFQRSKPHRRRSFWRRHSLSIIAGAFVVLWIVLYSRSNESHHAGSFFGNAIADWTGLLVMVIATKFLYERGSEESRPEPRGAVHSFLREHSLSIFVLITGAAWVFIFLRMDPQGKWGQVVGNIVSEWTQILGTVWMTKWFVEVGSKESKR